MYVLAATVETLNGGADAFELLCIIFSAQALLHIVDDGGRG